MLNRWQRRRLYPPPPPTPEGKCWRSVYDDQWRPVTGLVSVDQVEAHSRSVMEQYDSLDRWERDRLKQDTLRKRERARVLIIDKDLSVRANYVLRNGLGKYDPSPDEVWRKGRDYWRQQPNCGRRTVNEITLWLASHKLLWDMPARKVRKKAKHA